jgi:subtilisin family serine protease
MRMRRVVSVVLAAVLAVALAGTPAAAVAREPGARRPSFELSGRRPNAHPTLAPSLQDDLAAGTPVQPAVESRATPSGGAGPMISVVVEAADSATARAAVEGVGGVVSIELTTLVQADVPVDALGRLADARGVQFVREPLVASEAVNSEGVATTGANVWQNQGWVGTNTKVAIVDSGFAGYAAKLGTELPASVETDFSRCLNPNATEHGTAVAETVHDMAPNAALRLVCIQTDVDFVAALPTLAGAGVKVVNGSIGWTLTGRGDGSGGADTPAGAVAALRRQGILYVAAAGNYGRRHYDVPALGDGDLDGFGDFVDISPDDTVGFVVGGNATASVSLRWDGWPTTRQDFDLYVVGNACTPALVGSSELDQSGAPSPLRPVEFVQFTNCSASPQVFEVYINRYSGSGTPRLDLFFDGGILDVQYFSDSSLAEPATSPSALTVGATCYLNGAIESYSSRGPTIDGRIKPDLSGPDATSNSVYGASSGTCAAGFRGTSAATPHVAGAAALLLGVNPGLDVAELQQILQDWAADAGAAGSDNVYGAGRLTLGAPAATKPPTPQPLTAVTPVRLFDSRPGVLGAAEAPFGPSGRTTPLAAGEEVSLLVSLAGVPADATAVVLSVTATGPTGNGYLTVHPGGVRPNTANVNFAAGQTVGNHVTATIGGDGRVRVFNSDGGSTHVVVDLTAWYGPTGDGGPATSRFTPLTSPNRAIDTRPGTPGYAEAPVGPEGRTTPVQGNTDLVFSVFGGGVPNTANAVVLNVALTGPTSTGYVTVYPADATRPVTANLNFIPGLTKSNMVITGVSNDGSVKIYNSAGATDIVVDVIGYFAPGTGAGYVALDPPVRDLDTRTGNGPRLGPLTGNFAFGLEAGRYYGVPADAAAAMLNITAVAPTTAGYITIYPNTQALPVSANLNFGTGEIVGNAAIGGLGTDARIALYNSNGLTHIVSDLAGYFVDPALQPVPLTVPPP